MVSPVVPTFRGEGLALRMFHTLEAFLKKYSVTLWIVSLEYYQDFLPELELMGCEKIIYPKPELFPDVNSLFRKVIYRLFPELYFSFFDELSEWRYINIRNTEYFLAQVQESFDVAHISRLYLWPFAKTILDKKLAKFVQLDLDDIESISRARMAEIYQFNQKKKLAKTLLLESKKYEEMQSKWLSQVDRVLVCSELDKKRLAKLCNCKMIEVFPNTIKSKAELQIFEKPIESKIVILFVGALNYYPNTDALVYFCKEILPLICQKTNKVFEVNIVGKGLPNEIAKELRTIINVNLIGWVRDLSYYYQRADIAIVPLRAGGGTRIKILEAFSYKCPVVSTSVGAEGLEVIAEKELLIADDKEIFASKIVALMQNQQLRKEIGESGFQCFISKYSYEKVINDLVTLPY